METPKVRAAGADDVPALTRLTRGAILEIHAPFLDAESLVHLVRWSGVERRVRATWRDALLAEMVGEPVGLATLAGTHIELLWVRRDLRRRSIGSTLMDQAEARLASRGPSAELECLAHDGAVLRFYERRGYRAHRRTLDPLTGVEKRVLHKLLGP